MASSICSVMLPLVAAKSPEPLPLQKQQPLVPSVPSRFGQVVPPAREILYTFHQNVFVLVIQRVVRFIAPFSMINQQYVLLRQHLQHLQRVDQKLPA